jgi:hypothetical protein
MVRRRRKREGEDFGVGDYEFPERASPSLEFARDIFFRVIARIEPRTLFDLCCLGIPPEILQPMTIEDETELVDGPEIQDWGRRWNLIDEWARQRAVHTLVSWTQDWGEWEWAPDARIAWALTSKEERRFTFVDQGYDPALDHWPHFQECIEREFKRALAAYKNLQQARAIVADMVRVRPKRSKHLLWLARFQVKKESYGQIARGERIATGKLSPDAQAIYDAVKRTAKWLGLTLRTQFEDIDSP